MKKWRLLLFLLPGLAGASTCWQTAHGPQITNPGQVNFNLFGNTDTEFNYNNQSQIAIPIFTSGTISGMRSYVTSDGLTNAATSYLLVNGSVANQFVQIPAGTANFAQIPGNGLTDHINYGDVVNTQLATSVGGTAITIWGTDFNFLSDSTTTTTQIMVSEGDQSTFGTNGFAKFYNPISGTLGFAQTEDESVWFPSPVAGRLSGMCVAITSNTLNVPQTLRSRVNGANGNMIINVSAIQTGILCDTTLVDNFNVGDQLDTVYDMGNTGNTGRTNVYAIKVEFTVFGSTMVMITQNPGHGMATNSTQYGVVRGAMSWNTPEPIYQIVGGVPATLSGFTVHVSANAQTGSTPMAFRKNGASGNQSLSITAGTTGVFSDSTHFDNFVSTDQINDIITTTSAGALLIDWTMFTASLSTFSSGGFTPKVVANWTESGGYKMARQDSYIGNASSMTISRAWDGHNIKLFGGKGELLHWATYLIAGSADATNVNVSISSFTGTGSAAGSGFSAVQVSSSNVWDFSGRPYSLYLYRYLQEVGMNNNGPWDPSEFEMRQDPIRWRTPCTIVSNNQCAPDALTWKFTFRPDANKFYPDPAVPIEEFASSSFTVSASSSQAIGGEVYISTSLPAGTYTATETVYEGTNISTSIPIQLLVYNLTLPPTATIPVLGYVNFPDLNIRINGVRNPGNQFIDPYLTTDLRAAAFLHRFKITEIGDVPPTTLVTQPSIEYQKHLDGSAFTATYGGGNGPGTGIGDSVYVYNTYGANYGPNWSTSTVTGANGYCTSVASALAYCIAHNLTCMQYSPDDEPSTTTLVNKDNILATWNSTTTACASGGQTMPFMETGNLPTLQQYAPSINAVFSTDWIHASSATWQAYETAFSTTPGKIAAGYNSEVPGTDSLFAIQEQGTGPEEVPVGAYKYGQKFWFAWAVNYWNDFQHNGQSQNGWNANTNNDDDMFNISKNFGYDQYPTTDTIKGHTGFGFANGDGSMIYPGTDSVFANPSFGFNGVMGSWRLNELTKGIQLVDVAKMASAINPSATTTIINNLIQNAMWTNQCFDLANCSYVYGPRPWDETPNDWETARESLEQIVAGASSSPQSKQITGNGRIVGRARIQ